MKVRPVEPELFHADRQTGRYDEANCGLLKFCECAYKFIPCQEGIPAVKPETLKAMRRLGSRTANGALRQFS
jgi:hypothetical protein